MPRSRSRFHAPSSWKSTTRPLRGSVLGVAVRLRGLGPGDVVRAGAVARFARHVDLRPRRGETVGGRGVVLVDVGRVALGAHVVPVLVRPGPVQDVVVGDVLVRIQVKPALAALVLRAGVPADVERLHAAVGKGDQVLLQRVDAEGVGDAVLVQRPVRAVGAHVVAVVFLEEGRGDGVVGEGGVVEVAEDGARVGRLHGPVMVRAAVLDGFARVARHAGLAADELRRGGLCVRGGKREGGGEPQACGAHRSREVKRIEQEYGARRSKSMGPRSLDHGGPIRHGLRMRSRP